MQALLASQDARLVPLLGLCIATAQLSLLFRAERIAELVASTLVWMAAIVLFSDLPQASGSPQARPLAGRNWLGIALLGWCLLVLTFSARFYDPLHLPLPLVALVGVAALQGVSPRARTFRDLVLVACLVPLQKPLMALFPVGWIVQTTVHLACGALAALGVACRAQGTLLLLPARTLEVAPPCAGIESLALAITTGVVFLLLFPLRRSFLHLLALMGGGLALTFLVNAVRVVVLSFTSRSCDAHWWSQWCGFEFWHKGAGSQLFVLLAVGAVCLLWWWDIERATGPEPSP